MHWLQSASTARPSHPMPRPTRQNHHVTVWESNIDSPPSPQDNSDYEFSKMAGSEFPLILFEFIYSYYRSMFLWLIWLNFKSRVPYKDGMCMLPARRLRRLQYLSEKSLLRLLRRYAWCLKSRLHNYIPVVPGQAGGGSFQKEKNYIAQKEFAYRMCAWWPTSAMPKSFLCCERAFCPSMVVMFCALKWSVLMSWCLFRGQVMWWSRHLMRCDGLCCVMSRDAMRCHGD